MGLSCFSLYILFFIILFLLYILFQACMDVLRIDAGVTLTAHKSWFFVDEGVVALGSHISASAALFPIATTLDQRLLSGVHILFSLYSLFSLHILFPIATTLDQGLVHIFLYECMFEWM
jgi:hypothetical protein